VDEIGTELTVDPPLPLFYILGETRISISQETSL
jgi:hypothetical protein